MRRGASLQTHKTVPCSCCGKGLVGGDQHGPFCQGRGEVKAVVNRLIEVGGDGLGGRHRARRGQQLDRGRLDCREGRAGEIAPEYAAPRLRPQDVGTFDDQQIRRGQRLLQKQRSCCFRPVLFFRSPISTRRWHRQRPSCRVAATVARQVQPPPIANATLDRHAWYGLFSGRTAPNVRIPRVPELPMAERLCV